MPIYNIWTHIFSHDLANSHLRAKNFDGNLGTILRGRRTTHAACVPKRASTATLARNRRTRAIHKRHTQNFTPPPPVSAYFGLLQAKLFSSVRIKQIPYPFGADVLYG